LEEIFKGSVLSELVKKCAPINVLIVSSNSKFHKTKTFNLNKKDYRAYIASFLLIALTVLIGWLLRGVIDPTNFGMLLLLPAIASGILWGTRVGIFASLISVAAFDFFFIPPYLTFRVADLRYIPSFTVFIIVCVFISILSNIIRWQIENSKNRERFISSLYDFSKEIMSSSSLEDILYRANKQIAEAFNSEVIILTANREKNLINLDLKPVNDYEFAIAHWVYQNSKAAGKYTSTLSSSEWYYIPLITDDKTFGVLGIKTHETNNLLSSEQLRLIQSFANVLALVVSKYN
jgi:two-component system sensor histidine kinase KdpD